MTSQQEPPAVTELLRAAEAGSHEARDRLFTAVYDELRGLARRMLTDDRARHLVSPTELVHGAALKLCAQRELSARDRTHFLAYSAHVMRQVLIDHVRRERASKRDAPKVTLHSQIPELPQSEVELETLHEALTRLSEVSKVHARLVELRYFSGLTVEQIAALDGTSPATVKRNWRAARAWLQNELSAGNVN
jgi:RNA polymerase sigma factor (TIGR02999 family)